MTKLMILISIAAFGGGCQKATPEKACRHLKALATAKVDRDLKRFNMYGVGGSLSGTGAELKQKADFDIDTCAAGFVAKDIDTNCVADASTFDEATACLRRAKESGTL